MLYLTCVGLLNYPDKPAPDGWRLEPEVAAAMPTVSADGRTYTFTIKPGYTFSPPSDEPVTAETFRATIERTLSPIFDDRRLDRSSSATSSVRGVPRGHGRSRDGTDCRR